MSPRALPSSRSGSTAPFSPEPTASHRSPFPSLGEIADPRGPFLVPLLLLLATRTAFWLLIPQAAEDAYITFRYARNLVAGHGLVYNLGERVMGFSSPLWTLWSAGGIALASDPVLWTRVWSILADAVTLVVLGGLLKRHLSSASAWCFTFFFATWPYFSAAAVSGMENNAMFALIALSAALTEARSVASGPALAALALVRPEGIVAAAVLAIGARWRDRAVAAALFALALAGLAAYFGSVVPQSVAAKSQVYGTPGPWAGRFWWEWLSPFVMGRWPRIAEASHLAVVSVVMAPAFVVGAIEVWRLRRTALARAVGAALAHWLGYAILGVAFFWWYLVVPLGGIVALASAGLPRIVRGRAIGLAAILFVLGMWTMVPRLYTARALEERFSFGRAAHYLLTHARTGQKVFLEPIGMVGYQAPLVVVDEIGLVSPQVAKRRLEGAGWYGDLVTTERPDWLVVRRGMLRTGVAFAGAGAPFRNLAERDSVLARYEIADEGDPASGEGALTVLRRVR